MSLVLATSADAGFLVLYMAVSDGVACASCSEWFVPGSMED